MKSHAGVSYLRECKFVSQVPGQGQRGFMHFWHCLAVVQSRKANESKWKRAAEYSTSIAKQKRKTEVKSCAEAVNIRALTHPPAYPPPTTVYIPTLFFVATAACKSLFDPLHQERGLTALPTTPLMRSLRFYSECMSRTTRHVCPNARIYGLYIIRARERQWNLVW